MKKIIIISFIALAFASCNNSKENKANKTAVTQKPATLLQTGCYSYYADNNVIIFEITETAGDEVTGNLTYALDGKDTNRGIFKGYLSGNKLFGTYTFVSEGTESSREIAFIIKGNQLIEGYGKLTESGTAFSNKDSINYTSTMPLTKIDCNKLNDEIKVSF